VALIAYRDDLNVGGSLRVLETLARALDPRRIEPHIVFCYGGPGPIAARATVPVHWLSAKGPLDFAGWRRARRVLRAIDPDILHFHAPAYWLHAALVGFRARKVVHFHGPYFLNSMGLLTRALLRQTPNLVDASICITRGMRQQILDAGWGRPDRTWTVYNGIECDHFAALPSRAAARGRLGLPDDALVIGVVCRLAWYKGCRDAVRVLGRLSNRWHVVFCGDGPMRTHLSDLAAQIGVGDRVHFAGMVDDMRTAYAAMDAFLFASKLEPFGLVIAEAMAAHVPVFGLGGEGDYRDPYYPLVTPENAVFVERATAADHASPEPSAVIAQLAHEIEMYGRAPDAYRPMIDRAYRWVVERFDSRVQAEAMIEAYELAFGLPG